MSRRRLSLSAEFLQWFGLGGAALAWTAQLLIGFGTTVARCGAGGAQFGIDLETWELAAFATALAFVVAAEIAAALTVARTWGLAYDGPPPEGRRRFFAVGALVGNLLFGAAIVLSGLAVLTFDPCRQA